MTIVICICNYFDEVDYLQFDTNSAEQLHRIPEKALERSSECCKREKKLRRVIDDISAFYLLREIQQFTQYRQRLCKNPKFHEVLLVLKVVPPKKEIIDYKWNQMLLHTLWEKIEVDYMMSWLSTLGGGFSALGEQFSKCAETAGKISLKQLSIGMRLGDPFVQARCKLYYSISLIQTGRLRQAKYIVREQYRFAKAQKEIDRRLVKMCEGIWMRLQYEYLQRLKKREKRLVEPTET